MLNAIFNFPSFSLSETTSLPALVRREAELPFHRNVTLLIPVVVSSLVLIIVIFTVVVCLRKHTQERRGQQGKFAKIYFLNDSCLNNVVSCFMSCVMFFSSIQRTYRIFILQLFEKDYIIFLAFIFCNLKMFLVIFWTILVVWNKKGQKITFYFSAGWTFPQNMDFLKICRLDWCVPVFSWESWSLSFTQSSPCFTCRYPVEFLV